MQSRTRGGPTQVASILLALLVVMTAVFQTPTFAQTETGQIVGTVTDPQGAVIAGATITVQSKGTGATRTQRTTGDGSYIVSNLQPGDYDVKVEGSGFGAKSVPVRVTVGTKTTVDVALDVTGTGDVEASQLHADHATIIAGTTGEVTLQVGRVATVNAYGLGNVTVAGGADCTIRGPSADLVRCASD